MTAQELINKHADDHRMLSELTPNEAKIYIRAFNAYARYNGKRTNFESKYAKQIIKSYSICTMLRVTLERGIDI